MPTSFASRRRPALPYGLSPEHDWSPGTITLPVRVLTDLIDAICGEYIRATPARNLLIVNGHGGNRGILEAVIYDLHRRHDVNVCVIHPSSLATVRADSKLPEVHAGLRETSVMLALAPEDVHLDRLRAQSCVRRGHPEARTRSRHHLAMELRQPLHVPARHHRRRCKKSHRRTRRADHHQRPEPMPRHPGPPQPT
jgi:creatinine amidohydrolase/Fe(II)-dependent formamide hydrolase-like protein